MIEYRDILNQNQVGSEGSVGKSRRFSTVPCIRCSELLKSPHRFGKCDFYVLISISFLLKIFYIALLHLSRNDGEFQKKATIVTFSRDAFAITSFEEEKCERVETMLERTASQGLEPSWVRFRREKTQEHLRARMAVFHGEAFTLKTVFCMV